MYTPLEKEILRLSRYEYKDLLDKDNVVGVGLANKEVNGIITCEKCLQVFVEKKVPLNTLSNNSLIPSSYHGIKTDVKETGRFTSERLDATVRPTICGYAISPAGEGYYGTLGCLVTKGGNQYILSNNHVLADTNRLPLCTPIVQTAAPFGGVDPDNTIAYLAEYIPIQHIQGAFQPENLVDAAIAIVLDTSLVSPEIFRIGIPRGIAPSQVGLQVQKSGATTEYTVGQITAIGASIIVDGALFIDINVCTRFTEGGDSGSLVLDMNGNAVGLHFAGNPGVSSSNIPINNVLTALGIALVTS